MYYTIGHSDRSPDELIEALVNHDVNVIADLRSSPYSRHTPHFNREPLKAQLERNGIRYVFMGDVLGGRPDNPELYDEKGFVLYYRISELSTFIKGVERLETGEADGWHIALLCSEGNPAECHRHLLVSRVLVGRGWTVKHILRDDSLIDYFDIPTQPTLLDGEDTAWKSTRSVSPRSPQRSFLDF